MCPIKLNNNNNNNNNEIIIMIIIIIIIIMIIIIIIIIIIIYEIFMSRTPTPKYINQRQDICFSTTYILVLRPKYNSCFWLFYIYLYIIYTCKRYYMY